MLNPHETVPDPIGDALHQSVARLAKLAEFAAILAAAAVRLRARQLELRRAADAAKDAAEAAETAAAYSQDRARWEPALDAEWCARADTAACADAWCAAAAWADVDVDAAGAVGNCEARLADLHPGPMAHYRYRRDHDGMDRYDAMAQTLHDISNDTARPGPAGPVPVGELGAAPTAVPVVIAGELITAEAAWAERVARETGRPAADPAVQARAEVPISVRITRDAFPPPGTTPRTPPAPPKPGPGRGPRPHLPTPTPPAPARQR